jgi:hypothetical protein
VGVDNGRSGGVTDDRRQRRRIPGTHERHRIHRQLGRDAPALKRPSGSAQQPARQTHPQELAVQEKDLALAASPIPGGVEVNDG